MAADPTHQGQTPAELYVDNGDLSRLIDCPTTPLPAAIRAAFGYAPAPHIPDPRRRWRALVTAGSTRGVTPA